MSYKLVRHVFNSFSSIDNNTKTRLVAQSLSDDETTESYEWFLDCLMNATHNTPPIALFSDADPALSSAIASKLPMTGPLLLLIEV